jgi:hypothetical protein
MGRVAAVAWLFGLLGAMPLSAQDTTAPLGPAPLASADRQQAAVVAPTPPPACPEAGPTDVAPWETVWGLAGLRVFAAGPRVAPNGEEFHPSFSLDLNFNAWLWRGERIYLFGDFRFWCERPENGVTNGRDGGLGFSKREFDIAGGPAWNYSGPWEARVFGYSMANLNRGLDLVTPYGGLDGFGLENRYYLTPEYARLGQPGFDVARADFVGLGYYPTKDMVGNDGESFNPGLMLRAYLTHDLWDWPAYAFADATYISKRSLHPKLLLFDVGCAARPFNCWRQWEFRLGVENTADFEVHSVLNLWYASLRYIF